MNIQKTILSIAVSCILCTSIYGQASVINDKLCCDLVPQEYKTKNGKTITIPHFFTPNGDGVNDYFRPIVDEDFVNFNYISITYPEESLDTVKVGREDIGFVEGFEFDKGARIPDYYGWDGYRSDTDSLEHVGKFNYLIEFHIYDGKGDFQDKVVLEGSACAVRCDPKQQNLKLLSQYLLESSATIPEVNQYAKQEKGCFGVE